MSACGALFAAVMELHAGTLAGRAVPHDDSGDGRTADATPAGRSEDGSRLGRSAAVAGTDAAPRGASASPDGGATREEMRWHLTTLEEIHTGSVTSSVYLDHAPAQVFVLRKSS